MDRVNNKEMMHRLGMRGKISDREYRKFRKKVGHKECMRKECLTKILNEFHVERKRKDKSRPSSRW